MHIYANGVSEGCLRFGLPLREVADGSEKVTNVSRVSSYDFPCVETLHFVRQTPHPYLYMKFSVRHRMHVATVESTHIK